VSYGTLLGARVATAVAQALFWAVMGPVAVGLFAPEQRGRVMGALSVGGSLAIVLGVPAGTWLGQRRAWEDPFLVLGGLGVVALAVVAVLLPVTRPEAGHAAYGVRPDRWWFALVLVVTGVSVTGVFAGFTYLAPYLGGLGYPAGAVGPLLFVFGAAGVVGVAVAGPLLDRWPRGTLVVPLGVQTVALLGLYGVSAAGVPGARALAAVMLAALGSAVGPVFMATQSLVLRHAPGRTELALAANSAAFNAGVALGASTGGLLLPLVGVDGAFLVGGVGTVVALGVLVLEDRYRPGWARPVAEVRDMEDGGQVSRF
jgi:DHA1 family inner membrane transport protein